MSRKILPTSLTTLVIGAAALVGSSLIAAAPAQSWDGRGGRGYERVEGFRPAPPAYHGYWGHRQWRRHHDGYGFRAPPPPPRYGYGYGGGWR
ncbi:MAG: hypothetical protein ACK4VM_03575 [Bosea sp. (in: a-proteobacteria)]